MVAEHPPVARVLRGGQRYEAPRCVCVCLASSVKCASARDLCLERPLEANGTNTAMNAPSYAFMEICILRHWHGRVASFMVSLARERVQS
ncbi:hypothetical protein ANAPC5_01375 [Anaplasma phagocytophilum]|nr:hypothetical protein ANAPC5_01375 [Anaplasma phagocytophilum]